MSPFPFLRAGLLAAALVCSAAVRGVDTPERAAPPEFPPLSAAGLAHFDKTWARFRKREPNLGSREIYNFILNAAARGWRPEELPAVIDLVESMHDRESSGATYGNYRWYWHEAKPDDRNAVEFCMQCASLTWVLYHDRLTAPAREKLSAALALGIEGMTRHKVDVSYTNIFLMRLANCVLIGESTGRPELAQRGRAWLDEWFAYTRANGLHEFSSPTYYAVDLEDLGALARWSSDATVRQRAASASRLFWTEIAAHWFAPHAGLGGAHSRDYDFLTAHGILDEHLQRAGWLPGDPDGETRPLLGWLTHVDPPADFAKPTNAAARDVAQQWGRQPWERAVHRVGRHFSLGTAGAGYGAQDKVLALALPGGAKRPLVNFSFDYRDDPYGRTKIPTSGSHPKLTHLLPFVASVQNGASALLVATLDPAKTPSPAGKNFPIQYHGVHANFVLPADVELWTESAPLAADAAVSLEPGQPLFLRTGDVAAILHFFVAQNGAGQPAALSVVRDGAAVNAQRFTATLADGAPAGRITAAVWVEAAEGLDDAGFAEFRRNRTEIARSSPVLVERDRVDVRLASPSAPLHLAIDLRKELRLAVEGADPALQAGVLNVNGRDVAAALLP